MRAETIHAIITDNNMPKMTGMMLTRQIRESGSNLPIIMATRAEANRTA